MPADAELTRRAPASAAFAAPEPAYNCSWRPTAARTAQERGAARRPAPGHQRPEAAAGTAAAVAAAGSSGCAAAGHSVPSRADRTR